MHKKTAKYMTALAAFLSGVLMFVAVILPDLIGNNGILLFCADYTHQSIPFTYNIYDHLRSFTFGWDMSAGLGGDFMTSYAFYGLFSPFSLLYLPFPREILIYVMPYVTAVKYGCGTLFAYFYIRKFVRSPHFAVIGGMIYMFSSFTAYNEVFHFTDATALFPLFLIALDELCENGRKGVFALAVALMALTNYYFFFGQAVFAVIYFFCRYFGPDLRSFLKKLALTAVEAVIGVLLSCAVLLPVAYALLQSPKATGFMGASDMLFYDSVYKYLHIIQSVFSVPDGFSLSTLFPETDKTYPFGMLMASVAAYIPLFSAAGVISYCFSRGKTRARVFFAVCVISALVPVLNQSFSAFNSAFYARWYYMPILIGAAVSVKALEERVSFRPGIIACGVALAGLGIYRVFLDSEIFSQIGSSRAVTNAPLGIINLAVAAVTLVVLIITVRSKRDCEFVPKLYIFSFVSIYMCFGIMSYYNLTEFDVEKPFITESYVFDEEFPVKTTGAERTDLTVMSINYQMIWGGSGLAHFNSLHDPGFEEFLNACDMTYGNGLYSDISASDKALCRLLSVKYYMTFDKSGEKYGELGKAGDFGCYAIYEDPDYIPLGFTYSRMLSKAAYERISDKKEKHAAYLKYLIVDDPAPFADILELCDDSYVPVTEAEYSGQSILRRLNSAYSTEVKSECITSEIELEKENVVFYSVSFNSGWSAYVDGSAAGIYKVNNGLVGVRVPAGRHTVEIRYSTPMLGYGLIASAAGAVCLIIYVILSVYIKGVRGRNADRDRCRRHIYASRREGK